MSSILEALREIEGSRTPAAQAADEWEDRPQRPRQVAAVLAAIASVGIAGTVAYYAARHAPSSSPTTTSVAQPRAVVAAASTTAAADLLPAAPVVPPLAALLDAEPPRARVSSASSVAPVVTTAAVAAQEPMVTRVAARARPRADDGEVGLPRPSGEPRIAVSSVAYGRLAEDRSVVMSVDGGRPVTLHEGQAAGGVEVQLIQPDGVYVRHGGQIFSVPLGN